MNPRAAEPECWGRQRWFWSFAIVLGLQLGAIIWLGGKFTPPFAAREPATILNLPAQPAVGEALHAISTVSDPTLFALPHEHGFSGKAWLRLSPAMSGSSNWFDKPQWLPLPSQQLGGSFHTFAATNRVPDVFLAEPSSSQAGVLDIFIPSDNVRTQSTVKLEGALTKRSFLEPLVIPAVGATDLVPNSSVQVTVNAEGRTESAILLDESRSKQLDQQALELAGSARFKPLPEAARDEANVTIGKMVFQWHTVPPGTTTNAINLPSP